MNNNLLNKEIIKMYWEQICEKGEFPPVGEETTKCINCSFRNVTCMPISNNVVGCYGGWNLGAQSN